MAWTPHNEIGVNPPKLKTAPIDALVAPKTVTQRKSYMGSTQSLQKYLAAIVELSAPLGPLLARKTIINGLKGVKMRFKITNFECKHRRNKIIDIHKDIRIVCDASHKGLGAVLKQIVSEGRRSLSIFECGSKKIFH